MKINFKEKAKISRRTVTALIFVVSAAILLGFLIHGIFWVQHVRNFRIVGDSQYRNDFLIELSGIEYGEPLYGLDTEAAEKRIREGAPQLKSVRVKPAFFSTLVIEVEAEKPKYFAQISGDYFLLNEEFRVLEIAKSPDSYQRLMRISLPDIKTAMLGEKIEFNKEKSEKIVNEFLEEIARMNFGDYKVTAIGLEDRFHGVYIVLDGRLKIILGDTNSITEKVALALECLYSHGDTHPFAEINVSAAESGIPYRELEFIEY